MKMIKRIKNLINRFNQSKFKLLRYESQRNNVKEKETKKIYFTKSQEYTKERRSLHKQIIAMMEKDGDSSKAGERPVAILIGGGTASGKTLLRKTVIEKELYKKKIIATTIDLDEIKEYIPEYHHYKKKYPAQAAQLVHKESYDIGLLLLDKLIKKRKSFIYESTMARTKKYRSLVKDLRKKNYEIHVYIVDVPLALAIKRSDKRARVTGRKVPHHIIKNTHRLVPRTFIKIKNLVDDYQVFDNQNGLTLIVSKEFVDPIKYKEFLKKGERKNRV